MTTENRAACRPGEGASAPQHTCLQQIGIDGLMSDCFIPNVRACCRREGLQQDQGPVTSRKHRNKCRLGSTTSRRHNAVKCSRVLMPGSMWHNLSFEPCGPLRLLQSDAGGIPMKPSQSHHKLSCTRNGSGPTHVDVPV